MSKICVITYIVESQTIIIRDVFVLIDRSEKTIYSNLIQLAGQNTEEVLWSTQTEGSVSYLYKGCSLTYLLTQVSGTQHSRMNE